MHFPRSLEAIFERTFIFDILTAVDFQPNLVIDGVPLQDVRAGGYVFTDDNLAMVFHSLGIVGFVDSRENAQTQRSESLRLIGGVESEILRRIEPLAFIGFQKTTQGLE